MNIGHIGNRVTSFVKNSIDGGGPDRSKDKDADKIDSDFGTIQDSLSKVDGELAHIDETTDLKPPSLANVKDSQLLIAGVAGGAILGGAYGLLSNTVTSWAAQPSIHVETTDHNISTYELGDPKYSQNKIPLYRDVTSYDANGTPHTQKELQGYRLENTANVNEKTVGHYQTQTATVNNGGVGSPVWDGLGSMAVGAGAGALLAGSIIVGRKLTHQGEYNGNEGRKTEGDITVIAKMAGMGAVAGGAVGALSGMLANGNVKHETIHNEAPVFETRSIGQIPGSHDVGTSSPGNVDVTRQVPKMTDGILGLGKKPVINSTPQEITAGGGLNMMSGLVGGAIVGAGMGAAAGVLTNVLRKTL